MNDQISALLWIFAYVSVPIVLIVWLKWRGASMVREYLETERGAARARLAADANQRTRRAIWFTMLDQMYLRYTSLLATTRGQTKSGSKRVPSRRRA